MEWPALSVFLALARAGSHAGAARILAIDATTIGRKLAALESTLQTRLFVRSGQSLVLSESGRLLLPRAERVESELLAAERELSGRDARLHGNVRLTASDGVLHHWLIPALPQLRGAHPDLSLELRTSARELDLSRREADVAVRLSRPREPNLVARKLGSLHFGIFAAPHYLATRRSPKSTAELSDHLWIGLSGALAHTVQARWLESQLKNVRYAVRADTTEGLTRACAEGLGLALLPSFVRDRGAELLPVLPRTTTPTREIYCVTHRDLRGSARVQAVVAWLRALASKL